MSQQDLWIAGARIYLQRLDDSSESLLDMGTVQPFGSSPQVEKAELWDSDGGVNTLVEESITKYDESMEITCYNLALDNLALFYMASMPTAFTAPTGAALQDVSHKAVIGANKYVKIKDAAGAWLYNVTDVVVTNDDDSVTYVEGDDYELRGDRGLLRILAGGAITDGDTIKIDVTLNSTTGKRLLLPATDAQNNPV